MAIDYNAASQFNRLNDEDFGNLSREGKAAYLAQLQNYNAARDSVNPGFFATTKDVRTALINAAQQQAAQQSIPTVVPASASNVREAMSQIRNGTFNRIGIDPKAAPTPFPAKSSGRKVTQVSPKAPVQKATGTSSSSSQAQREREDAAYKRFVENNTIPEGRATVAGSGETYVDSDLFRAVTPILNESGMISTPDIVDTRVAGSGETYSDDEVLQNIRIAGAEKELRDQIRERDALEAKRVRDQTALEARRAIDAEPDPNRFETYRKMLEARTPYFRNKLTPVGQTLFDYLGLTKLY